MCYVPGIVHGENMREYRIHVTVAFDTPFAPIDKNGIVLAEESVGYGQMHRANASSIEKAIALAIEQTVIAMGEKEIFFGSSGRVIAVEADELSEEDDDRKRDDANYESVYLSTPPILVENWESP